MLGSMSLAFSLGIQTANDVEPVIGPTNASDVTHVSGDFNGNGQLDIDDAKIALDIAEGRLSATAEQLQSDMNGDERIDVSDALLILEQVN